GLARQPDVPRRLEILGPRPWPVERLELDLAQRREALRSFRRPTERRIEALGLPALAPRFPRGALGRLVLGPRPLRSLAHGGDTTGKPDGGTDSAPRSMTG